MPLIQGPRDLLRAIEDNSHFRHGYQTHSLFKATIDLVCQAKTSEEALNELLKGLLMCAEDADRTRDEIKKLYNAHQIHIQDTGQVPGMSKDDETRFRREYENRWERDT